MTTTTTPRAPWQIAAEILEVWPKPYFGAVPYLQALSCCSDWGGRFHEDSVQSLGLYLLSNLSTFRGEDARRIKAEIKEAVK